MHPEEELILDLSAPVRSFRLFALEQLLKRGVRIPDRVREALREREKSEEDPECRQLLAYVLELPAREPGDGSAHPAPSLRDGTGAGGMGAGTTLSERYLELPDRERLPFLRSLPPEIGPDAAEEGFLLLAREPSPILQGALLRVFSPGFSPARLNDLLGFLEAPSLSLRMTALEVLVRRRPEALLRHLPGLLTSDDPRVRALAVQGLAAIDLEEALGHLDLLLESTDPSMALAALRNSIFFPWDRIKPLFLKGLSLQKDLRVIENLGLILQNNPDPEIPFRVWSLTEGTSMEKKKVLEGILENCLRAIEDSGILAEPFSGYLTRFRTWTRMQKNARWLRELLDQVESCPESMAEVEAGLLPRVHRPDIREVLLEAQGWPLSPTARDHLRRWLDIPSVASPRKEGAPPVPAPAAFRDLPLVEQIRALGAFEGPTAPDQEDLLQTVLAMNVPSPAGRTAGAQPAGSVSGFPSPAGRTAGAQPAGGLSGHPSPDLLATAMRTALRLGDRRFLEIARATMRSAHPNCLAAGIEYLGTLDPDSLLPYLGRFLTMTDPRVSGAVFRIWRNLDATQSLATLGRLLVHPARETRRAGLSGMIYFDFVAVRPLLFAFLQDCPEEEDTLFDQALFFFASNPETDNLYDLYRLEKMLSRRPGKGRMARVAATAAGNARFLLASGQIDQAWLDGRVARFEARMAEQERQETATPASYSRKALRPAAPASTSFAPSTPLAQAALGLGLVLLAGGLWLTGPSANPPPVSGNTGAVVSRTVVQTGLVTQVDPLGLSFQGSDGRLYHLLPPPGRTFAGIGTGTRIQASLLPFRKLGSDSFKAQCLSFQP